MGSINTKGDLEGKVGVEGAGMIIAAAKKMHLNKSVDILPDQERSQRSQSPLFFAGSSSARRSVTQTSTPSNFHPSVPCNIPVTPSITRFQKHKLLTGSISAGAHVHPTSSTSVLPRESPELIASALLYHSSRPLTPPPSSPPRPPPPSPTRGTAGQIKPEASLPCSA